ncbi:MAG: ABC transporter ATP-binding protein [Candidatus Melainabacteria bacterium]|nr:ABC transporter ATP-binding protein [Candidatus Melainabacteria bacterium]
MSKSDKPSIRQVTGSRKHEQLLKEIGAGDIEIRPFFESSLAATILSISYAMPDKLRNTLASDLRHDAELRHSFDLVSDTIVTSIKQELSRRDGPQKSLFCLIRFTKPGTCPLETSRPVPICLSCRTSEFESNSRQLRCSNCNETYVVHRDTPVLISKRADDVEEKPTQQVVEAVDPEPKTLEKDSACIALDKISKKYNIYDAPIDRLKELILRNRRSYHKEFWALKDISLAFRPGCTAILGPNGSGKSTLLQIIAGTLQPTTGAVRTNGRITAILELGSGFQSEYSGRENALLYGMLLGIPKDEMLARLPGIAQFAELGDFFDQPIKTYSSGMFVRLAFSCAVTVDPDILIVDEALSVGDQHFQQKCFDEIARLRNKAKTIIFVSHDIASLKLWCDRAILLHLGKVVLEGNVSKVADAYEDLMHQEVVVREFTTPTLI